MKHLIVLFILLATGCSKYTASQVALIDQARKGVALWNERESSISKQSQQLYDAKRAALDAAFDADVRDQRTFDADWIITHRKAYAVGLEVLSKAQSAAIAASEASQRNAAATDAALQKLRWLMGIEFNLQTLLENGGGQ